MARKLDKGRLFRAIRLAVILVSVLSLTFATVRLINQGEDEKRWFAELDKCKAQSGDREFCYFWLDIASNNSRDIYNAYKLGIGLPVIFFGGIWVINYFFPKKDE